MYLYFLLCTSGRGLTIMIILGPLSLSDDHSRHYHHCFPFETRVQVHESFKMSGRPLSHGTAVLVRRSLLSRQLHSIRPNSVGGLLRTQRVSLRGRPWPVQASFVHNAVATRSIAFARILPKLALKMVRLPAMFGGAMVAGMAYVQYQAVRK